MEIHYVVGQNGNPNKDDNVWLSGRIGHVVAEFNRRKNAKVTFAHQQMNAQAGYSNGGMAPFGYLNQEEIIIDRFGVEKSKTKYEIDPDRAPAIKIAFDMYLDRIASSKLWINWGKEIIDHKKEIQLADRQ